MKLSGAALTQTHTRKDLVNGMVRNNVLEKNIHCQGGDGAPLLLRPSVPRLQPMAEARARYSTLRMDVQKNCVCNMASQNVRKLCGAHSYCNLKQQNAVVQK